jgi:hypothetical protein
MRGAELRELFTGVAWKRLSSHEVDSKVSHGHEFQGINRLRDLLGSSRREYSVTYLFLDENGETLDAVHSTAKWYDSRENVEHRSPEWRLYYPAAVGTIQARMKSGDLMVIAKAHNDQLFVFLLPSGSDAEAQLRLLFELDLSASAEVRTREITASERVGFLTANILDALGISSPLPELDDDEARIAALSLEFSEEFPDSLPSGAKVAQKIQEMLKDVDAVADPDGTLVRWIEAEDAVFRRWEDGLIRRRLLQGFSTSDGEPDVQAFRKFSMAIRQSRVSRAGGALQQHAAKILRLNRIRFDEQAVVDHGEKPDFLFPGLSAYRDPIFPASDLRMLGAKFTAKDRWRQVLNEASRISPKHLLTLEATISSKQLHLMQKASLIPVLPQPYLEKYSSSDQEMLVSLAGFIATLPISSRM